MDNETYFLSKTSNYFLNVATTLVSAKKIYIERSNTTIMIIVVTSKSINISKVSEDFFIYKELKSLTLYGRN